MHFGKGSLVAGHRVGSFTPTFDGAHLTLGGAPDQKWGLSPLRHRSRPITHSQPGLDTPISYFSGAGVSCRHIPWGNGEVYVFQLNEGDNLQQRDLTTAGFRFFAPPTANIWDYEIESMYQIGTVEHTHRFAHRHHGEVGYSFTTDWPFRRVYLFDYASGDRDPDKNFVFLFAKRRAEYGHKGIFGVIFPSNILSPVGFRSTVRPIPTVTFMISHRLFWLADARAPFVGAGLQDPTGRAGIFLGNLFDTSLAWSPQTGYLRHTVFEVGFLRFFKGSYFERVPQSPGTADVNDVYTMATLSF